MDTNIKKIAVFTSGGDSPGMNAAIAAIAKESMTHNIQVAGIMNGYDGMIDGAFINLNEDIVKNIVHKGGTILKSARCQRFLQPEYRKQAMQQLTANNIDAMIAVGGDGTFRGLLAFSEICSLPCIGIPGTIDNDLYGTDYTLGFDTAVNNAVECIDKIRDTAASHERIFIVEVMGRDAGYIALSTGLGAGADGILIPETSADMDWLMKKIICRHRKEAMIIVVAEGDEVGANLLAEKIKKMDTQYDIRVTVLGHIQRGGHPSAMDRMLGIRLGVFAVKALLQGEKNKMAGIINNRLQLTPFEKVVKQHEVDKEMMELMELFDS
ncbi:ATP-dependent 6-phosphofructokinase [Ferruginibacter profundus]